MKPFPTGFRRLDQVGGWPNGGRAEIHESHRFPSGMAETRANQLNQTIGTKKNKDISAMQKEQRERKNCKKSVPTLNCTGVQVTIKNSKKNLSRLRGRSWKHKEKEGEKTRQRTVHYQVWKCTPQRKKEGKEWPSGPGKSEPLIRRYPKTQ